MNNDCLFLKNYTRQRNEYLHICWKMRKIYIFAKSDFFLQILLPKSCVSSISPKQILFLSMLFSLGFCTKFSPSNFNLSFHLILHTICMLVEAAFYCLLFQIPLYSLDWKQHLNRGKSKRKRSQFFFKPFLFLTYHRLTSRGTTRM